MQSSTRCLSLLLLAIATARNLRAAKEDKLGWPADPTFAEAKLQQLQANSAPGKLELHEHEFSKSSGTTMEPIPGCFIVQMEGTMTVSSNGVTTFDTTERDALISQLRSDNDNPSIQSAKAVIGFEYNSTNDGFSACLSPNSLQTVLTSKAVAFVEQDTLMSFSALQRNPIWGLDRVDQTPRNGDRRFSTGTLDGAGIDVYVIDTGVNTKHVEYAARLKGGKDFVRDGRGYEDCNGHGSHCAGTVLGSTFGVAKEANLYGVRVLGCTGSGSNSGILAGVDWSVKNAKRTGRPSVLSMSLGGGKSSSSNLAVAGAKRNGVTVVVAAGNENTNACTKSPASETSVITVASSDRNDRRSSFSNYGACIDLFAPGSQIKSAWIGGRTRTNTISGTSMATPHVAGAAALELELLARKGGRTDDPDAVWRQMRARATQGKIADVRGSPNLLLRTPSAASTPTNPTNPARPGCGTTVDSPRPLQQCVFPFVYRGVTHTSCTTTDDSDSKAWCSTRTDARSRHIKGNWGYCNSQCAVGGTGSPAPAPAVPAPTRPTRPTPRFPTRPGPGTGTCTTTDHDAGKRCVFPFIFQGRTYTSCTAQGDPEGELWCSTMTDARGRHIMGRGKWGHCASSCAGSDE